MISLRTIFSVLAVLPAALGDYILLPKNNTLISLIANVEMSSSNTIIVSDTHFRENQPLIDTFFYWERDTIVSLPPYIKHATTEEDDIWHLNRIVNRKQRTNTFSPGKCNQDPNIIVNTYIVDTGIDVSHPQFGSRATWLENFSGDHVDTDCNQHGTHVAGLVGSQDYGVCTDANLFAIKVLSCEGSGSNSGVIKGIEHAFLHHVAFQKAAGPNVTVKGILNMSLGGGKSSVLNRVVQTIIDRDQHFYFVVAAGNENNDACYTSPASVKDIITVMASDISDNRAYFSNWGTCADIYSPGVRIKSTIPHNSYGTFSGTSMASPIAAGVLNNYVSRFPRMNMTEIKSQMQKFGTRKIIRGGDLHDSRNVLVWLNQA